MEGFLSEGHSIWRLVAVEKNKKENNDFSLGINNPEITYSTFYRKKVKKTNIVSRFLTDSWTQFRMSARVLFSKKWSLLFEDFSYSSHLNVICARLRRKKVVTMVQDLWPENAAESGIISRGSFAYRLFHFLSQIALKKSDRVVVISEDLKKTLIKNGIPEEKIRVIYNWGYSDEITSIPWESNRFVKKYKIDPSRFYPVYAGNIGRLQNVELVLHAAKELENHPEIHFLIIGDGVKREEIQNKASKMGLKNLTLLPLQDSDLATSIYSMASVNLIPLIPGGIATALPSKTGICLSCGKPIIACLEKDSFFAKMIISEKSGLVVDPSDPKELSEAILDLSSGKKSFQKIDIQESFKKHFRKHENVLEYCKAICFD